MARRVDQQPTFRLAPEIYILEYPEVGTRENSWKTVPMPNVAASCTDWNSTLSPSIFIEPDVGR